MINRLRWCFNSVPRWKYKTGSWPLSVPIEPVHGLCRCLLNLLLQPLSTSVLHILVKKDTTLCPNRSRGGNNRFSERAYVSLMHWVNEGFRGLYLYFNSGGPLVTQIDWNHTNAKIRVHKKRKPNALVYPNNCDSEWTFSSRYGTNKPEFPVLNRLERLGWSSKEPQRVWSGELPVCWIAATCNEY